MITYIDENCKFTFKATGGGRNPVLRLDGPSKKHKISKKSDVFWRKILEKYSQLFLKICS